MRVLVTGAAGFIGRHMVRSALIRGDVVVGVDSFITSERDDLERESVGWENFSFHESDVRSPKFKADGLAFQPELIVHLACPTGVPNLEPLAYDMLTTSFDGTRNVLEIAEATNARVVVASSAEVYGDPQVSPQTEYYNGSVDTLGPRRGYEEGKRVAETLSGIAADSRGVQVALARIFNTFGPGMSLNDTRVVPSLVRAALEGRELVIHGDGLQTRCHCYVSDTVDALWKVLLCGKPGRAYNIGSTSQKTIVDLAQEVKALVPGAGEIVHTERPAHDHQSRLPDTARIRDELGWSPEVDLRTGLESTVCDFQGRLSRVQ
ncbi:MAG: NAD-dependent epimerase/dehydratase family protein [Dehalococcoidia bacterium]